MQDIQDQGGHHYQDLRQGDWDSVMVTDQPDLREEASAGETRGKSSTTCSPQLLRWEYGW